MSGQQAGSSEVLRFWFEEAGPKKWWVKDVAFDATIRTRFEGTVLKPCR